MCLSLQPQNAKALYRRGLARKAMGAIEGALKGATNIITTWRRFLW